jgi:hypothetical protein
MGVVVALSGALLSELFGAPAANRGAKMYWAGKFLPEF